MMQGSSEAQGWRALNDRATQLLRERRFEESAVLFEQIRAEDDSRARLTGAYGLGVLRFNQGRFDDAERHFLEVVERASAHADALHSLGLIAERRGRPADALAFFGRALGSDPGHRHARGALARLLTPPPPTSGPDVGPGSGVQRHPADRLGWSAPEAASKRVGEIDLLWSPSDEVDMAGFVAQPRSHKPSLPRRFMKSVTDFAINLTLSLLIFFLIVIVVLLPRLISIDYLYRHIGKKYELN